MIDLSFSVNLMIFDFPLLNFFMAFLGLLVFYWLIKWVISLVMGG